VLLICRLKTVFKDFIATLHADKLGHELVKRFSHILGLGDFGGFVPGYEHERSHKCGCNNFWRVRCGKLGLGVSSFSRLVNYLVTDFYMNELPDIYHRVSGDQSQLATVGQLVDPTTSSLGNSYLWFSR